MDSLIGNGPPDAVLDNGQGTLALSVETGAKTRT
jgi:hypothetical protein